MLNSSGKVSFTMSSHSMVTVANKDASCMSKLHGDSLGGTPGRGGRKYERKRMQREAMT